MQHFNLFKPKSSKSSDKYLKPWVETKNQETIRILELSKHELSEIVQAFGSESESVFLHTLRKYLPESIVSHLFKYDRTTAFGEFCYLQQLFFDGTNQMLQLAPVWLALELLNGNLSLIKPGKLLEYMLRLLLKEPTSNFTLTSDRRLLLSVLYIFSFSGQSGFTLGIPGKTGSKGNCGKGAGSSSSNVRSSSSSSEAKPQTLASSAPSTMYMHHGSQLTKQLTLDELAQKGLHGAVNVPNQCSKQTSDFEDKVAQYVESGLTDFAEICHKDANGFSDDESLCLMLKKELKKVITNFDALNDSLKILFLSLAFTLIKHKVPEEHRGYCYTLLANYLKTQACFKQGDPWLDLLDFAQVCSGKQASEFETTWANTCLYHQIKAKAKHAVVHLYQQATGTKMEPRLLTELCTADVDQQKKYSSMFVNQLNMDISINQDLQTLGCVQNFIKYTHKAGSEGGSPDRASPASRADSSSSSASALSAAQTAKQSAKAAKVYVATDLAVSAQDEWEQELADDSSQVNAVKAIKEVELADAQAETLDPQESSPKPAQEPADSTYSSALNVASSGILDAQEELDKSAPSHEVELEANAAAAGDAIEAATEDKSNHLSRVLKPSLFSSLFSDADKVGAKADLTENKVDKNSTSKAQAEYSSKTDDGSESQAQTSLEKKETQQGSIGSQSKNSQVFSFASTELIDLHGNVLSKQVMHDGAKSALDEAPRHQVIFSNDSLLEKEQCEYADLLNQSNPKLFNLYIKDIIASDYLLQVPELSTLSNTLAMSLSCNMLQQMVHMYFKILQLNDKLVCVTFAIDESDSKSKLKTELGLMSRALKLFDIKQRYPFEIDFSNLNVQTCLFEAKNQAQRDCNQFCDFRQPSIFAANKSGETERISTDIFSKASIMRLEHACSNLISELERCPAKEHQDIFNHYVSGWQDVLDNFNQLNLEFVLRNQSDCNLVYVSHEQDCQNLTKHYIRMYFTVDSNQLKQERLREFCQWSSNNSRQRKCKAHNSCKNLSQGWWCSQGGTMEPLRLNNEILRCQGDTFVSANIKLAVGGNANIKAVDGELPKKPEHLPSNQQQCQEILRLSQWHSLNGCDAMDRLKLHPFYHGSINFYLAKAVHQYVTDCCYGCLTQTGKGNEGWNLDVDPRGFCPSMKVLLFALQALETQQAMYMVCPKCNLPRLIFNDNLLDLSLIQKCYGCGWELNLTGGVPDIGLNKPKRKRGRPAKGKAKDKGYG